MASGRVAKGPGTRLRCQEVGVFAAFLARSGVFKGSRLVSTREMS